ncbi:MobF family relaxase [Sphingomonas sp. NPDC079357]|uniref:MobF family relaxase n=1 Tax=Sphingomonas sp. NPDC079357 TaxID=3364518 RepID=UPI00385098AE
MLSVATVRSAKGAAGYFAADNYYSPGEAETSGEWFGKGAEALGLTGNVDKETFEALLKGSLPDGSQVGTLERHRAGIDLTFSLPKSWSLLALVGGDRRILDAYRAAVKETLGWAERNAAEARMEVKGKEKVVATGNLIVAFFEHDTSREQEPQAHLHAIVANATQGPDGKWRALHNDKLWSLNTLFNAMTMASFRDKVEALGYAVGDRGKHGNFEAEGIGRNLIMAFSTRRQQILAKVAEMAQKTPEAFAAATLMTRSRKAPVADRESLYEGWRESARSAGLDLPELIEQARARGSAAPSPWERLAQAAGVATTRGRELVSALADRLGLARSDPYLPRNMRSKGPAEVAAAHSVASALRHLEQREAAFKTTDIYKAALDTGLPTGMAQIEARLAALARAGQLVPGTGHADDMMTTAQGLAVERRILSAVGTGRGAGTSFLPLGDAGAALRDKAQFNSGIVLNPGQEAAGVLLLSSTDRIIAVQGVAGAGKSSMLAPAARLIEESGQKVLGLAVQNTLVQMLERETGIRSMTVARFLRANAPLLSERPDPGALTEARATFGGTAILVDEASMLSNADQLKLVDLANLLGVGRMAFVGDARQLGAIDAGKPFSVMQQAGATTAHMPQNIRARGDTVKTAAAAAQIGNVEQAMTALKPFTIEAPGRGAEEAAERWLALAPDERSHTAIYASGRRLRGDINRTVQEGLLARGEIGPASLALIVLERVNVTNEELRYAQNYAPGMVLDVSERRDGVRLAKGRAEVVAVDASAGTVRVRGADAKERTFRPDRLRPTRDTGLQLYERKDLTIHERDRIRWTASDHNRGLFNADRAQIVGIDRGVVSIETSLGVKLDLKRDDPMLQRLDLAYALNAHMAQGLTSDAGIAVMETRDTKLVNQQTFLVTVTRLRDTLTLIVDHADGLQRQLVRNAGGKTSSLETAGSIPRTGAPGAANEGKDSGADKPTTTPEKALDIDTGRGKVFEIGI